MRLSSDTLVVTELRRRLFMGELRSGSAVNISDVADDLGVSNAPVRDALIKLSERGLIDRVNGRGFFVATTPDYEASELLDILHQIMVFSIERSRPSPEVQRWRRGYPAEDNDPDRLNAALLQTLRPDRSRPFPALQFKLRHLEDGFQAWSSLRPEHRDRCRTLVRRCEPRRQCHL
ncbi:Bacterial regulatory protein, GntR family [Labrenzia sp. THAF82]|uniref:GntR family transcriptional regulator n=1 Tax=Labrenzia sp. THAF82 TaxID=2587861 RepID=UPI0012688810|nr:Bacterial regulatory protein, GntR family [Labrenzia sp. THAF82]